MKSPLHAHTHYEHSGIDMESHTPVHIFSYAHPCRHTGTYLHTQAGELRRSGFAAGPCTWVARQLTPSALNKGR